MGDSGGVTSTLRLDEHGRLDEDLLCLKCDYNLRSLTPTADCPECGTPVRRSQHRRTLRACSPQWLDRLRRGFLGLWLALLTAALFVVLRKALRHEITCNLFISPRLHVGSLAGSDWLWASVLAVLFFTGVAGTWLITSPEYDAFKPEPTINARKLFRYGLTVALIMAFVSLAVSPSLFLALNDRPDRHDRSLVTVGDYLRYDIPLHVVFLEAVGLAALMCLLTYLRMLAWRLPARTLARVSYLADAVLVTAVMGLVIGTFAVDYRVVAWWDRLFTAPQPPSRWPLIGGPWSWWYYNGAPVLDALTLWLLGVYGLFLILLLPFYMVGLSKAAKEARATWARDK